MATFLRSFVEAIAPSREIPWSRIIRLQSQKDPKLPHLVVVHDLESLELIQPWG